MGCDIHPAVEVWDGERWRFASERMTYRSFDNMAGFDYFDMHQNYTTFSILAGVRMRLEGDVEPISEPRGLPNDRDPASYAGNPRWVRRGEYYDLGESFGDHSWSWVTAREILDWPHWERVLTHRDVQADMAGFAALLTDGWDMEVFIPWDNRVQGHPAYRDLDPFEHIISKDAMRCHIDAHGGAEVVKAMARMGAHWPYMVDVEIPVTYRSNAGELIRVAREMTDLAGGDPDQARLIFGFDS